MLLKSDWLTFGFGQITEGLTRFNQRILWWVLKTFLVVFSYPGEVSIHPRHLSNI